MTTSSPITLYGVPHSLYTGRARSYLIKAGIPYRERAPNTRHFHKVVKPKAGGRNSVPTVELASGDVIRDGAAIIDHFEAASGHPFSPSTPKQNLISRLFDVIGAEGLLRPAMHYRWNFDDENLEFLLFHFEMIAPRTDEGVQKARGVAHAMKTTATQSFGVVPDSVGCIEEVYADQLAALDRHFAAYGYLLGGRPCVGDFGMMAPLFAHLGRDPKPLALMQARAKHVVRWVERMNRVTPDLCEYESQSEDWLADDEIPATLVDVLRAMAEDFVPETLAAARCINTWLAEQGDLANGTPSPRGVGLGEFELRAVKIKALAQPYRFFLLQRVHDAYAALDSTARAQIDELLAACSMTPLLNAKLERRVGLANNMEVWL